MGLSVSVISSIVLHKVPYFNLDGSKQLIPLGLICKSWHLCKLSLAQLFLEFIACSSVEKLDIQLQCISK